MDEKKHNIVTGNNEEERQDNIEFILSQVSPDMEKRDMMDVLTLVEAALVSQGPPVEKLDLWGQAIFSAYRQNPIPEEIEQWITHGVYLARDQLVKRLLQLNLDQDLTRDTLTAIVKVYQIGSPLYKKYNLEAFRVSQVYFYDFLFDTKKTPIELVEEEKAYTFCIGVHMVGFANIAEYHYECLATCKILGEMYEEFKISDWFTSLPDEMKQDITNKIFVVGFNAVKAAAKIGRFSEALYWSKRTEPYVSLIDDAWMKSDYFARRGEVLIALGQAAEAQTWLQKSLAVQGLTDRELNDAKKRVDFATGEITGDFRTIYRALLPGVPGEEDVETLDKIIESIVTGNIDHDKLSKAAEMLETYLSPESLAEIAQNTSLNGIVEELNGVKHRLIVQSARIAIQDGDIEKLETLIPGIEELAKSEIADRFRLDAAFFLVRYRQHIGKQVDWQTVSPLVSKLLELPGIEILNYLLDVSYILLVMEQKELLKASETVAGLVKKVTFYDKEERTLTAVVQQTAFRMGIIESFLTLLFYTARVVPENSSWWLESISRLKYLCSYRGQGKQKEAALYRYASELLGETTRQVKEAAETLARYSLENSNKGYAAVQEKEQELMTLLYPLFSRDRWYRNERTYEILYPEITHIETANFYEQEEGDAPVISVECTGRSWGTYAPQTEVERGDALDYREFLKQPEFLEYIVDIGRRLRSVLLPMADISTLPYLMGVRSTGVYHRIPLETLPLVVDENTDEIKHWVGEEMTSVLLTGPNKDMEILEKPLPIKSIAVFANSSFGDRYPGLSGTVKETEAIVDVSREDEGTDRKVDIYRETESNRENFLRLSGEGAPQILHIATHGITYEDNPSASFIALSGKKSQGEPILGAVGYHDIILMDLRRCDLVVLSACSTHEGRSILGEGIMGLAWAFKAAGAKAVIATRWQVDDEMAVVFWRKFYENLCNGLSIGKAFHESRQQIIRQEKWNHPFYWGVFQLIV